MEKDILVSEVRAARENLRARGIRAGLFLQFGYPGETWSDIRKTISMVRAVRPDDVGISVSYPLPNTRFHEMVRAQNTGKTNWDDSGDMDVMFQGAYTARFYKALAEALHREVRSGEASAADAWKIVAELEPVSRSTSLQLPVLAHAGAA